MSLIDSSLAFYVTAGTMTYAPRRQSFLLIVRTGRIFTALISAGE